MGEIKTERLGPESSPSTDSLGEVMCRFPQQEGRTVSVELNAMLDEQDVLCYEYSASTVFD